MIATGSLPFDVSPAEATAWAAIVTTLATIVLVGVTWNYVRLTGKLLRATEAQLSVDFQIVVSSFTWVGVPRQHLPTDDSEDRVGPFPELVRVLNIGLPVFIHAVTYDETRSPNSGGAMGTAKFLDPPDTPAALAYHEELVCGFGGAWAFADGQLPEVVVAIEYSLKADGGRTTVNRRVRVEEPRDLPWGSSR